MIVKWLRSLRQTLCERSVAGATQVQDTRLCDPRVLVLSFAVLNIIDNI